ncbi:protein FAM185A isoform X1 [Silurus asotus]|uniref:Protein FAM185A isoform X1 n=1 Tax=Silurus asotus TaxID=30991 RepID=A0AAD5FGQ0_SILAS|nr:protein FAM185A isoform X1 [Silurus asotus]
MRPSLFCGIIRLKYPHEGLRHCTSRLFRAFLSDAAKEPSKQWSFTVSPFTKIFCQLSCGVSVKPLDTHSLPGAEQVCVTLLGRSRDDVTAPETLQVHYDDQSKKLEVSSNETISNLSVELTAPIKSDLHIVGQGKGNVKIQNMESDVCQVQTEKGHCILQSVKCHKVQVRSSGGNITGMGTINGDVEMITAEHSRVDLKKIQGTSMNISTEHGPLNVKAIYAEKSAVASSSGKIHIGHIHGEALVNSDTGDIIIDSSSGVLTAHTNAGNIDAYVSQTGTAELHTQQGAVSVRVPSTLKAWVHLCGTSVEGNSEILQETQIQSSEGKTVLTGPLNGGTREDCWISAIADRGTVSIKTQSWFETLKLGS